MRNHRAAAVLVVSLCLVPWTARAEDPAPTPTPTPTPTTAPSWTSEISVNGFVSVGYTANLEKPDSRTNALRVFDTDDGSVRLDVVEVVVQKEAKGAGAVGFRVDATAGAAIPWMTAASGLFRDVETGKAQDFDLQQAYVSWLPSASVRLDAGKFVTHLGQEVIEGYDGFNDNYSRSLLFGYAIPFTHTGVKATWAIDGTFSLMGLVTNGWDNVRDNNRSKSFGGQLAVTTTPVTAFLNYIGGKERDEDHFRHTLDAVVVVRAAPGLTVTLNGDWGRDEEAAGPGRDAEWYGVAAYVRYNVSDSFGVTLRGETFTDRDGFRTGTAQRVEEITLTPEVRIGKHLVLRGEIRRDSSDADVFAKRDRVTNAQTTLGFNVIALF